MTFISFHYRNVSSFSDIILLCQCNMVLTIYHTSPWWWICISLSPHICFTVSGYLSESDFSLLSACSCFFFHVFLHASQLWLVLLDLEVLWIFTVPANDISLVCVKGGLGSLSLLHPCSCPLNPFITSGSAIPCLHVYNLHSTSRVILGKDKFLPYVHVLLLR